MPEDFCETLVREEDHDRFLATLFAPADARPWLYALYAFDLEVTRVAGRVSEPFAGEIRLQWWRDVVSGVGGEQATGSPVAAALIALITRFPVATERLIGVIEARRERLYQMQGASSPELEEQLAKGDGAIFALAALILGAPQDDNVATLSRHSGIAFGLTRHVTTAGALPDDAAMTLAGRHLAEARTLLKTVPAVAWPAFLILALVRPTLSALERGAPSGLPQWRRQWLLWRAARNLPARI